MRTVLILLMAFSLMAFAQAINSNDKVQNAGGNFGRALAGQQSGTKQ